MKDNDDNLLEIYDSDDSSEYNYFEESKENASNWAHFLMAIGFLVVVGAKFFQSLPGNGPDENAIILRQVKLLDIVQTSTNQSETQRAILEYDSLQRVLQSIEE